MSVVISTNKIVFVIVSNMDELWLSLNRTNDKSWYLIGQYNFSGLHILGVGAV